MTSHAKAKREDSAEDIGLKLLKSVREMKANKRGRVSSVEANDVAQARHGAGLSQAQFA